jgi:hypothetical protein
MVVIGQGFRHRCNNNAVVVPPVECNDAPPPQFLLQSKKQGSRESAVASQIGESPSDCSTTGRRPPHTFQPQIESPLHSPTISRKWLCRSPSFARIENCRVHRHCRGRRPQLLPGSRSSWLLSAVKAVGFAPSPWWIEFCCRGTGLAVS